MADRPLLTGVGVGPGDPRLLTLMGLDALRGADVVLVPARDDRTDVTGHAEQVVRAHCPDTPLRRVPLALTDTGGLTGRRTAAWGNAGDTVAATFADGARRVAFATVGDPAVYSTFGYVAAAARARVAGLDVTSVPGVTAMQALAAESGAVLCEGREPLVLLPARDDAQDLETLLRRDPRASVVIYKAGSRWPAVRAVLAAHGRLDTAVVGTSVGRPGASVQPAGAAADVLPYFATVLAPPVRATPGGTL